MFRRVNRPPCKHMEPVLNEIASGRASKLKRFFAWLHMVHCGPCRRFMESLNQIVDRLRSAKSSEEDDEAISRLAAKVQNSE